VRRREGLTFSALFGLALLAAPVARAESSSASAPVEVVIEIEQAPGSEACPDKEAVFRSIQHLFPERTFRRGSAGSKGTAHARVTIRPLAPGHQAILTLLPPGHGERVIQAEDEACRGLADALALAFMMLVAPIEPVDPLAAAETKPAATLPDTSATPEPKPSARQESARTPVRTPESAPRPPAYRAGFGASFVGGLGLLSEPALGAAGEIELFHRRGWGLSVQGLRLWSQPAEAEGGSVTLTLWGLLLAPCYRLPLGARAGLDACLRFGMGSQHASVQGFLTPESGNFPWLVLVPSVGYRQGLPGLGDVLSGFVRVGLVGQLNPQSFSVRRADGSGNVEIASAPTLGVMTEIGLMFGSGLF